jgi:SAM-dependent methyltransferase
VKADLFHLAVPGLDVFDTVKQLEAGVDSSGGQSFTDAASFSTWESAAPGWVKWEHVFSQSLRRATDTLIDMAGIKTGARVLDVACGGGSQTFDVAKRVGPSGVVVANHISRAMLDHVGSTRSLEALYFWGHHWQKQFAE